MTTERRAKTAEELGPCPFCDAKALVDFDFFGNDERVKHFILCSKCLARSAEFKDQESAITAWNTRAGALNERKAVIAEIRKWIFHNMKRLDPDTHYLNETDFTNYLDKLEQES